MRIVFWIGLGLVLAAVVAAQEPTAGARAQETAAPQVADRTSDPAAATSIKVPTEAQATPDPAKPASTILPAPPSSQDVAEAKKRFKAGARLKSSGKTEAAFEKFEQASQLDPRNLEYVTAREFARQRLVMEALER